MSACRRLARLVCCLVLLGTLLVAPGAISAPPAVRAEPPPSSPLAPSSAGVSPSAVLSEDFATFFPITSNNTGDVRVVVDGQGRLHGAISAKTAVGGIYPAYYGYCATGCETPGNWTWIAVDNHGIFGGSARVAVDDQGRPRMMWVVQRTYSDPATYVYAACDAACTSASNWYRYEVVSATDIADFVDGDVAGAYFALDPDGNPRFIYRDINEYVTPPHTGTYYAFCDGDCLTGNWYEEQISTEVMSHPSLVIDSTGEPHVALYGDGAVWYAQTMWFSGGLLWYVGSGHAFSLALDSQDRPRLALYTGYYGSGDPENDLLALSSCDGDCNLTDNWDLQWLGTGMRWGSDVALALDAQDRPHLAMYVEDLTNSIYGLAYAHCTAGCSEVSSADWELEMVDDGDNVEQEFPVLPSGSCTPLWADVGERPSLALGAGGRPYIGYDAIHYQGITCSPLREDMRLGRMAVGGVGGANPTATPVTPTPVTPTPVTPTPVTPTPVTPTQVGPTATAVTPNPPGNERVLLPLVRKS